MEMSTGTELEDRSGAMLLPHTEQTFVNPVSGAQAVMRQVEEELRQLLRQQAGLKRRISTLKKTVSGLASVFGESAAGEDLEQILDQAKPGRKRGFTKTCRAILREANGPISARELCDRMRERDPGLIEPHNDPIASATTVLNRLVKYGEADRVILLDNKNSWRWASKGRAGSSREWDARVDTF